MKRGQSLPPVGMGNPLDLTLEAVQPNGTLVPGVTIFRVPTGGSDWPLFNEHTYRVSGWPTEPPGKTRIWISGLNSGGPFFLMLQGTGTQLILPAVSKKINIPDSDGDGDSDSGGDSDSD